MFILALESSTSSSKAMLYDTSSETYEIATKPYRTDYPNEYTAFRPDSVYEQLLELGRELVHGREVDIIALSSAWHSVGLFDGGLNPVTPMYQWSSTYGSELCRELRRDEDFTRSYYNITGCMVNAIYPYFKLRKLAESFKLSDYRIMGQGSYNNLRLTGAPVSTDCILSGSGLMNIHTLNFAPELLEELGISSRSLADICTYKEPLTLCGEAARGLGIKPGIPVVPTCSDGALNQVGAGALAHGVMTFSVGTSGALRLSVDSPRLADDHSTWCYRSPASWLSGAATNGGTNCVEWFRRLAFDSPMDYTEIERRIKDEETTPVFLPFVFGERCPGWNDEMSGGFHNLRARHDRYDMYLGIEEGILFNLYQCYEKLTAQSGQPQRIRFSGGILHSQRWSQMCANIFGRELEIDRCEHASLMGAVTLAKERLGLIEDVQRYSPPAAGVIQPDGSKAELYKRKYARYIQCYNEKSGK